MATCIGVLVYSKEHKVAIVYHVVTNPELKFMDILNFIVDYKLDTSILEYKIIKGFYENKYNLDFTLEQLFKNYPQLFKASDIKEKVMFDDKTNSNEFIFDASKGMFIESDYDNMKKNILKDK